jgi:hypothetical protein
MTETTDNPGYRRNLVARMWASGAAEHSKREARRMDVSTGPLRTVLVVSSVLGMLFAEIVAIGTWIHLSGDFLGSEQRGQGANVNHALVVASITGVAGPILFAVVRKQRLVRSIGLLVAAACLGVSIALVALDSATYEAHRQCFLCNNWTVTTDHLGYLYVLWGFPAGLLLLAAVEPWLKPRAAANGDTSR